MVRNQGYGRVITVSVTNRGTLDIESGVNLTMKGGQLTNEEDGTIIWSNTLNISGTTLNNNGLLVPGGLSGIANATISGVLAQGATGTTVVDIDETGNDHVTITVGIDFNELLNVRVIDGINPAIGNSYQVVNYASRNGAYQALTTTGLSKDRWHTFER